MFDKNFYPTPEDAIFKMLLGEDLKHKTILEPSAGKGDILDYIVEKKLESRWNNDCKGNIYAIEKSTDLQSIIKEKGYKLVGDDFLEYHTDYIFDYIIMNPPFDTGAKHLLKAWEISKGAKIICLLNTETYNNPCTKERMLLKQIIDEYGIVENLGNCFNNAERKTNVNVILVKLQDKKTEKMFSFEGEKEKVDELEIEEHYDISKKDTYGNLELRYNKVKEIAKKILELQSELDYYGSDIMNNASVLFSEKSSNIKSVWYNNFLEEFRKKCWDAVICKTNIADFTTSKVRNDFYKAQSQQGFMAFTKDNIVKFFQDLFYNQENIMQNCVEEAFDIMTKYHKENRVHVEGWKTNDRWKVTKKVILPNVRDSWHTHVSLDYTFVSKIQDIEKALCFLVGKKISEINSVVDVVKDNRLDYGELSESELFTFRVYKKGTIHLTFKDKDLYEKFNITACKYKNWLGS